MGQFQYRAVSAVGTLSSGVLEAPDLPEALSRVRQLGVTPIAVSETNSPARIVTSKPAGAAARRAVTKAMGELAVLLAAGLSLDRALSLAIENIDDAATRSEFAVLLDGVKEGVPLSRAMAGRPALFPPMAQAMVEAGEANGQLADALGRLATTLERAEDLRQLLFGSMIYPVALLIIAVGVIGLMLLFVVPQFESVFAGAPSGSLPSASLAVMNASHALRDYGWYMLGAVVAAALLARSLLRRPEVRAWSDRALLRLPQLGTLIVYAQTTQFARTLAVLVDGGVALPVAVTMAQRTLSNTHLAAAVERVANGLKQGGGLTAPLAATGVFPKLAIGFFRTGEETSQLGLMLGRLADVLDRDVRLRLSRLIAILTPAITVVLGAAVAGIIAAIMTAILGFNDLAVG